MPGTHGRESPGGTSLPATGIQHDLPFPAQCPPTFRQPFFSGNPCRTVSPRRKHHRHPSEAPSAPVGRPVSPLSEDPSAPDGSPIDTHDPSALIGSTIGSHRKTRQPPIGSPIDTHDPSALIGSAIGSHRKTRQHPSEALSTLMTRRHLSKAPSVLIGNPVSICRKYCRKPAGSPSVTSS